jgi:hypothetical protein
MAVTTGSLGGGGVGYGLPRLPDRGIQEGHLTAGKRAA